MPRPPVKLTRRLDRYTATPGHMNREHRLKYVTVQEHLDQAMMTRARLGNTHGRCPICEFYQAHLDDDVREVERLLLSDPSWGPDACCDTIRNTRIYNNAATHPHGDLIADEIQHDCALALIEYHPFDRARQAVERLLADPKVTIAPRALYCLLAYVNQGHPNPRRFLEQPHVRARLPADLPVHLFPAPDFD